MARRTITRSIPTGDANVRITLKIKVDSLSWKERAEWIQEGFLREMKKMGKIHVRERDVRVRTWHEHPDFKYQLYRLENYGARLRVIMQTADMHNMYKYHWIDKGTDVRYATMTRDFRAKTAPGRRTPHEGQGGLAYVKKSVPRAGIEARQFEETIKKKVQPRVDEMAEKVADLSLNRKGRVRRKMVT